MGEDKTDGRSRLHYRRAHYYAGYAAGVVSRALPKRVSLPWSEDSCNAELRTLALQLSPHAYRLVRDQYVAGTNPGSSYIVDTCGDTVTIRRKNVDDAFDHTMNMKVRLVASFGYLVMFCIIKNRLYLVPTDIPVRLYIHENAIAALQTRRILSTPTRLRVCDPSAQILQPKMVDTGSRE